MEQLWAAYRTDTHRNPFGRDFVGYAGWHADAASALAMARVRYPHVPESALQVNRA